ncbi:hypothetical protein [Acidihalobacter prosperus]|uniref:Uncharacterized protein n=1 Tax=Acidihalobacter prosperus TaxID=160660 RepID=A0A1A6C4G4_9GAMM|nr:hypothetical protein [Acidihalobacter prosperus]OBS09444.1 hypothetical protein Thpro_021772 [Acidihalobacter prosperus]
MPLVSTVIVILTIIGLAIATGVLASTGLTTGALGTGTLAVVVVFFTWAAFVGVRSGPE